MPRAANRAIVSGSCCFAAALTAVLAVGLGFDPAVALPMLNGSGLDVPPTPTTGGGGATWLCTGVGEVETGVCETLGLGDGLGDGAGEGVGLGVGVALGHTTGGMHGPVVLLGLGVGVTTGAWLGAGAAAAMALGTEAKPT